MDNRSNMLPTVDGRMFTGPVEPRARWAQITASALVNGVTLYSWTEMTPYLQTLVPLTGGMSGTPLRNPVIEVNNQALTINSFVKVMPGYFDNTYDVIYYAVGVVGSAGGTTKDASETQDGTVNLVNDQVLGAGRKIFQSDLTINQRTNGTVGPGTGLLGILGANPEIHLITNASPGDTTLTAGTVSSVKGFEIATGDGGGSIALTIDGTNTVCNLHSGGGTAAYEVEGNKGQSFTITLAKITPGGTNGSITFTGGIATAHVNPT